MSTGQSWMKRDHPCPPPRSWTPAHGGDSILDDAGVSPKVAKVNIGYADAHFHLDRMAGKTKCKTESLEAVLESAVISRRLSDYS